ncbi:hypothetical protein TMEN_5056 [Trichophyton mentagrophytes]|nr:hypothetical protein TMEN_5056 [Trichophyton mentagrophytes]
MGSLCDLECITFSTLDVVAAVLAICFPSSHYPSPIPDNEVHCWLAEDRALETTLSDIGTYFSLNRLSFDKMIDFVYAPDLETCWDIQRTLCIQAPDACTNAPDRLLQYHSKVKMSIMKIWWRAAQDLAAYPLDRLYSYSLILLDDPNVAPPLDDTDRPYEVEWSIYDGKRLISQGLRQTWYCSKAMVKIPPGNSFLPAEGNSHPKRMAFVQQSKTPYVRSHPSQNSDKPANICIDLWSHMEQDKLLAGIG